MSSQMLTVNEYSLYRKDRLGRGGGVAVYVWDKLKSQRIDVPNPENGIDQLWLKIKCCDIRLVIGVVYRPPNVSYRELSFLYDVIPEVAQGCDMLLCVGDFNLNVACKISLEYKFISDLMFSFNLVQIIDKPTRINNNSESIIDLIITDKPDLVTDHGVVHSELITTDHEIVYCDINCVVPQKNKDTIEFRNLNAIDFYQFQADLQGINWLNLYRTEDINTKVNIFNQNIMQLFDVHAPMVTKNNKKQKPPWLTFNLKQMIMQKNKAYHKYIKLKSEASRVFYLEIKNYVSTAVKQEKQAYFTHQLGLGGLEHNDSSTLWKKIKSLKIINQGSTALPESISDPEAINDNFLNKIPNAPINANLIESLNNNISDGEPFQFRLLTTTEVFKYVLNIKSNAMGADKMSAKMLKMCMPYSIEPLTNIVNSCLEQGRFPDLWKMALITPIPKKENPCIDDLRPINILPAPSKVLERAVKEQLVEYLEKNKILPKFQSGFRRNYSCTTALLKITNDITTCIDRGDCMPLVLIDMTKAFDSLNTELLLAKLKHHKVECNDFFHNYLTNRKQAVQIRKNGVLASAAFRDVTSGVPQGSILGPLLFSIFSADVEGVIKNCSYHLYADDLQIYMPCKIDDIRLGITKINEDLKRITDWTINNSLFVNPNKTQAILFNKFRSINTDGVNIVVNNTIINWQNVVKNLGLYMDSALSFDHHVSRICQNCFFKLKSIYEYKSILPTETKRILTDSLVLSIPNYLDSVYGSYLTVFNKYRIQKIQNSCSRYVRCIPLREHISHHNLELFGADMSHRRTIHLCSMIHKIIITQSPDYLNELILRRSDTHQVNIRHGNFINIPSHRTEFFKSCFQYQVAHCYNQVPANLKTLGLNGFKRSIKDHIVSL